MSAAAQARQISSLLERQREDLRKGDFEALRKLAPTLIRAAGALEQVRPDMGDEPALQAVKGEATRQAELLSAALNGLRAAEAHLRAKPEPAFTGYDAMGRQAAIGRARPSVERRS